MDASVRLALSLEVRGLRKVIVWCGRRYAEPVGIAGGRAHHHRREQFPSRIYSMASSAARPISLLAMSLSPVLLKSARGVHAERARNFVPQVSRATMRKCGELLLLIGCATAGASCNGGAPTAPTATIPTTNTATVTTTSTTTTTTPTPTASPVPVSISYALAGPAVARQISSTRWDYVVGDEATYVSNLAGKRFSLAKIQLDGSAISGFEFANFDVEVHLNGRPISMRSGTFAGSTVNPDTGFPKPAASQLRFSLFRQGPYDPTRNANLNLGLSATFTAPATLISSPPPYDRKSTSPVLAFDLTDGLHVQLCLWSGSEYTYVVFRDLRLIIEGSAE